MQNSYVFEAFDPTECQFSVYVDRFEQFCIAMKITEEPRKIAAFNTVLGNKYYQLLTNLMYPDKPSSARQLKVLTDKLESHFEPKTIEVAERHKFYNRFQTQNESIVQFVNDLKRLSLRCNFEESLDKSLRDQFLTGIRSPKTKTKLLTEANLTFEKAVQLAQQYEAIERDLPMFGNSNAGAGAVVNAFHNNPLKKTKQYPNANANDKSSGNPDTMHTQNQKPKSAGNCTDVEIHNIGLISVLTETRNVTIEEK
jgi:hypothetical protein